MKCPKCGGNGFVPTNVFGVNGAIKCDFCDGTGVFITNAVEPMTNEEWFCQLPTEEKAEKFVILCRNAFEAENYRRKRWKDYQNIDWWKEWLKQPHQGE